MNNIAFIPVRGGSKSIPLKNIKSLCGKPLVYWTVKAACECKYIDKVYVCTDSDKIRDSVKEFTYEKVLFRKVELVERSAESATDTASTEYVMLEFTENHQYDNIALVQATSPLLEATDLEKGFELFSQDGVDSVLSVISQKRFIWDIDDNGYAYPSNYDIFNRPRRQDFKGYYVENGAFYITSRTDLIKSRNRLSGHIKFVEMREESFFEIDEEEDWIITEQLLLRRNNR